MDCNNSNIKLVGEVVQSFMAISGTLARLTWTDEYDLYGIGAEDRIVA